MEGVHLALSPSLGPSKRVHLWRECIYGGCIYGELTVQIKNIELTSNIFIIIILKTLILERYSWTLALGKVFYTHMEFVLEKSIKEKVIK